jgi:hypothetical protein
MSGGSWNYLYCKIDDAANNLCSEKSPLRRAFGEHMKLVAKAMHEIEWVDSGDCAHPRDYDAIKKVFEDLQSSDEREIRVLINDGKKIINELKKLGCE